MKDLFERLKTGFTLDKQTHFLASGWQFFVLMIVFNNLDWAIGLTAITFLAKEFIWDEYLKKGTFDVGDMIASLAGLITSLLIWDLQGTHSIFSWLHNLVNGLI